MSHEILTSSRSFIDQYHNHHDITNVEDQTHLLTYCTRLNITWTDLECLDEVEFLSWIRCWVSFKAKIRNPH